MPAVSIRAWSKAMSNGNGDGDEIGRLGPSGDHVRSFGTFFGHCQITVLEVGLRKPCSRELDRMRIILMFVGSLENG